MLEEEEEDFLAVDFLVAVDHLAVDIQAPEAA